MLLLLLACSSPEPPAAPEVPDAAEAPAASAAAPEPPAPPPAGAISGAPILPKPVVIGGISAEAVDEGIAARKDAIDACYTSGAAERPGLTGKVLVKFKIDKSGVPYDPEIKSTSLRHAPTEQCLSAAIAAASFPALERGGVAIVSYPFAFPPG